MSREFTDRENTGSNTMNTVNEMASDAKDKVFDAAHSATSTLKDAAGKFGSQASDAAKKIAKGVESTTSYLHDHSFSEMGDDLMNVCRKYPAQALISSLAIGFLVGRLIRR